jgi:hypothetical protein
MKRCTAWRAGSVRARGSGGVAKWARCRARSCAERGEWSRGCTGTHTPLSASPGIAEHVQSEARARPMGGLGGRGRLGELGGGEWDLVAQWRSMASSQSLVAMGGRSGHAGEGEREQGEVGVVFPSRVGSR